MTAQPSEFGERAVYRLIVEAERDRPGVEGECKQASRDAFLEAANVVIDRLEAGDTRGEIVGEVRRSARSATKGAKLRPQDDALEAIRRAWWRAVFLVEGEEVAR